MIYAVIASVALVCVTVMVCFRWHLEFTVKKIELKPLAEMHLKLEAMDNRLAKMEYGKLHR